MTADRLHAAPSTGDPFSAFERTPALLAACQALQSMQLPNDSERMYAAFSATYDADPADPSMADDLAKFCDGWQAAQAADELPTCDGMPLRMLDRAGAVSVARMREAFEKSIRDTPVLQQHTKLDAAANGEVFSHYVDSRTDVLWLGFALGMRAAARLAAEDAQKPDSTLNVLASVLHDHITGNQAAWIEWQHGAGAEAAMKWIQNGLAGPGHIPDEDAPYGREPQAWFDANQSNPLPQCFCGRPSNIGWMAQGFCCKAHYTQARSEQQAACEAQTATPSASTQPPAET